MASASAPPSAAAPSAFAALKGTYKGVLKISLMLAATYLVAQSLSSYLPAADYRSLFGFSNRIAVWVI
ncbi:MAG: hypothetical protein Q8O34_07575, partial [Rhodocyclaceae bacterium]|nr:hypothetical protein [Rhodocyclaceae bacterium]